MTEPTCKVEHLDAGKHYTPPQHRTRGYYSILQDFRQKLYNMRICTVYCENITKEFTDRGQRQLSKTRH